MHQQSVNTGDKDVQIVRYTGVPSADQLSEVFVGTIKGQNRDDSSVGLCMIYTVQYVTRSIYVLAENKPDQLAQESKNTCLVANHHRVYVNKHKVNTDRQCSLQDAETLDHDDN